MDKLNFDKANSADQDIDKIFSEMLMPPPVSAIFTPKVTKHEGNVARSAPKYFPTVHVSPPPSPIKPLKASPEVCNYVIGNIGHLSPLTLARMLKNCGHSQYLDSLNLSTVLTGSL